MVICAFTINMKRYISLAINRDTMPVEKLLTEEVEKLGYYDFMGYLEVPFFNIGGVSSLDRLAELLIINKETRILEVGCGTGGNACYLANKYGCHITGIDIAEHMVKQAQIRAEKLGLTHRVTFKMGDAYDLDFSDNSFDIVFTIFVSQFLDLSVAFKEFSRVLNQGGRLGINEIYKEDDIPLEARDRVEEGERIFREITELPLNIRSNMEWRINFEEAGFKGITIEKYTNIASRSNALKIANEFGGWWKITTTIWEMLKLAMRSKRIRKRMGLISKGKRILLNDRVASKYIGYILCVGNKS
jgi:ubiquinone/menaquinone biosynthesis C-methylase UbiE